MHESGQIGRRPGGLTVRQLRRALTGCGCSVFVFIVALALTGSFGFQRASVHDPWFTLLVIVGLGAPFVSVLYLLWLGAQAVDGIVGRRPHAAPVPGRPDASGAVAEVKVPKPVSLPMSAPPRRRERTALLALVFVLLSGVYLWIVSSPLARAQVSWAPLLRDAAIGFVIGWFVRPQYDARRGRETRPSCRSRWFLRLA